ncbi:unnamed protein product [Paramecium sonneborni]|uniref:Transmembrane protein n=1 Tax=Paramecium sonneborni TaxID=65129 RepID=A0A8S1RCT1_9CILI|nr:unnamed protein product [Paramecium sonneborni]
MQLTNGDLLIIQQFSDQTVGQILKYDFLSDQFIQFQTFSFPLKNEIISEINIVANILLTQTSLQFYIFCINEDFIRQIYQSKIKINVAFIQNTLEEYLIQSEDTEFFIMKHCYLNQNEISFINTYHLSKAKILQSFQELTSIYFNVELQNNLQIKINNSAKNNIYITINCIFSYQNFLFYVKVQLNTVQTTYELNIQKILRHYERIENFFHINEYLAIISNYQNQYIYDLKQEQYFYDPIYQMVTNQIILQDYNNTHFFLFNLTENKAYIVEIGYEINIQSKKKSQDCLLIARNEISQAEINVFIQQEELSFKQQYDRGIIILLIIIITITILLIFIFRRNKLKQHKLQSFKLNISMDQSRQ